MTQTCPSKDRDILMKNCIKCYVLKPLGDYYKHPGMTDGHLGTCKECHKSLMVRNYTENRSEKSAYDKARFQKPERKAKVLEYQQARRLREPQKYKAREMVGNAVRDGRLFRQPCQVCGETDSEAHHEDYSKPLDVMWLCFVHHREHHGQTVTQKTFVRNRKATASTAEPPS